MKLYHYTSIDTLFAMFENSIIEDDNTNVKYIELWARHTSCLADKSEYKLFTDRLIEGLKEYAQSLNYKFNNEESKILNRLNQSFLYTISLTNNGNSPYMWKHYGDNHTGVCLEFDFALIPTHYLHKEGCLLMEYAYDSFLTKCNYIGSEEIEIEKQMIEEIYQYIVNGNTNTIEKVIKNSVLLSKIEDSAIAYKKKEYSAESEFRIVLGSVIPQEHLKFPIPISAISNIVLGSSIKDVKSVTQKIIDGLGESVNVRISECLYDTIRLQTANPNAEGTGIDYH